MKKYLFIAKSQIMSNMQYITNIFGGFIGFTLILIILFNLYQYLYSDPNELINGYSMHQMIWYVIITELLWSILGGSKMSKKIANDVKSGNITYNINKPYSYVGYCLASNIGDLFLKFIFYTIFGMVLGIFFVGHFPNLNIISALIVIVISFLALVISILFITSIGLVSFFIEDASPLYWLYSKFILVLGTIFPIEFFPVFMQKILIFSPIYVVSYGPARLFVNFNYVDAINIFCAQVIYIFACYALCSFIYGKGVKRINVNGG
ncbi:MAG: ABC-2 family transporter protein [Bacilli bacterium]|nr:ABC-2 family transporter protein [Bacilli bacterium]